MKRFILCIWLAGIVCAAAQVKTDKIRLRDGAELEGTVSGADGTGFNLRSKYGSVHYNWTQLDYTFMRTNTPALYEFMVQKYREQLAMDQITTDEQILKFLAGKFVFKTEANKNIKNYGSLIQQLDNSLNIKSVANRNRQLGQIGISQRALIQTLSLRAQQLSTITINTGVQSLLTNFRRAMDALLTNDHAAFIAAYSFCKEALAQLGY